MSPMLLVVNGQEHQIEVDPDTPLLWVLRDILGLTGTKYSCGVGFCGSCTVHHNGEAIRACVTDISEVSQGQITTIEGISSDGNHPLQKIWLEEHVSQCGYCQPGQLMAALALLNQFFSISEDRLNEAMTDILCRCGTYQRIRNAVLRAEEEGIAL